MASSVVGVCCICGEDACSRVIREDDDGDDIELFYCKEHLRGHKTDESFFG